MLGLDDPAAGLTAHQISFANERHARAQRAIRRDEPRHAERLLREAVAAAPTHPGAWADLGVALTRERPDFATAAELAEVKQCMRRALRLDPWMGLTLSNFATVLWHQGRFRAALRLHRLAVERGCDASVHAGLGAALWAFGDLAGAEASYRRALAQEPGWLGCALMLAELLVALGRHAEARRPSDEAVRWMLDEAWPAPLWDGSPPAPGRDRLVLDWPQGLGDQLLVARYVPALAALGWRVTVACTPPLARLLGSVPGVARVVEVPREGARSGRRADAILWQILAPWLFGTAPAAVPPPAPVRPDPDDVRRWRDRLAGADAPRVGLVWGSLDPNRSIPLAAFAPLGRATGARFYGLQVGPRAAQAATPPAGLAFEHLGGEIEDFADLAAIMVNLDAVVSVDTGPLHLAGTLGMPALALIPTRTSFFWGYGRATPWNPTMRLFHQRRLGDWSAPVAEATDELRRLVALRRYDGPLVGLRGVDENGVLTTWLPRREAGTPTTA